MDLLIADRNYTTDIRRSISLGQHGQERSQVEEWKFKVTILIELTARS